MHVGTQESTGSVSETVSGLDVDGIETFEGSVTLMVMACSDSFAAAYESSSLLSWSVQLLFSSSASEDKN